MKRAVCSILTTGDTVIYSKNDNGNWEEPCFIDVKWEDDSPLIYFEPLALFNRETNVPPVSPVHIITSYTPAKDVETYYQSFLDKYHQEIRRMVQ